PTAISVPPAPMMAPAAPRWWSPASVARSRGGFRWTSRPSTSPISTRAPIGEGITVDELAHHFGTIGYEVMTSLGKRYARIYKGGNATAEPPAPPPAEPAVGSA